MKVQLIKAYCGLALFYLGIDPLMKTDMYACVDMYTGKVKANGGLKCCEEYFDSYVERLSNRDVW